MQSVYSTDPAEMKTATGVQILISAVCISHSGNTLKKKMNLNISALIMGNLFGKLDSFVLVW